MSYNTTIVYHDKQSAAIYGAESLTGAMANAESMLAFYLDLGYTIDSLEVKELCSECNAAGQVRKNKKAKGLYPAMIPCKACNGEGFVNKIDIHIPGIEHG